MALNKIITYINRLPLPNKGFIIFGLALVWWIVDFMIEYKRITMYYTNLLASGSLPSEADSISIPILSYVFGDIILGLIFSSYLLWALIGIKQNNKAIKFNKEKPARSSISWTITAIWIGTALLLLIAHLKEGNLILASLQLISLYCAIATNAVIQNK